MRSILCALAATALLWAGGAIALERFDTAPLTIETQAGPVDLTVELAESDAQKAQGLMYRRSLPADHGMLFDYRRPRVISMWMKNTYIPLDMIFIGADDRVVDIARRTTPQSLSIIESSEPARAVLEVNGGMADRWGVRIGDRVRSPQLER